MQHLIVTPYQLAFFLRRRRKSLGLTQREAGERMGLLSKTISLLESDPMRCSVESLYKYLAALEVEILLQGREEVSKE